MARIYQILLPLLGLFLTRVDLTDLFPLVYRVEVLKIYDGDTIQVAHGLYRMKIRLSKIDAPEKDQPSLSGSIKAGLISTGCIKTILKRYRVLYLKIEGYDMYQRVLGDVNDLSFQLIKNGCVALYPYAVFQSQREKQLYLLTLQKAKNSRLGVWKYGGFRQPKLWRKSNKRIVNRQ